MFAVGDVRGFPRTGSVINPEHAIDLIGSFDDIHIAKLEEGTQWRKAQVHADFVYLNPAVPILIPLFFLPSSSSSHHLLSSSTFSFHNVFINTSQCS